MVIDRMIRLFKNKNAVIYHAGAWAGNFGDSIIQQSIKNNISAAYRHKIEFRYINCQTTEFDEELITKINKEGDLLIVGGGGLVFHRPQDNSKSGWQWNIEIERIKTIKIPFVVYGVGYNQFEYATNDFIPITNNHLIETVRCATLFSVRNHGSKDELLKRGCDGKKIEVIPDSGMFLGHSSIAIPGMKSEKLKIGFNWTTDREEQTFPAPFPQSKDEFIDSCIHMLNYAIENMNAQVFYIGHMGSSFDEAIINRLTTGLIEEPIIIDKVLSEIYPPNDKKAGFLVDIYRQMDVVFGMRGHSNIVAFGQNTPFVGIGSHRKIRYFLKDIGREAYFFDVRPEGDMYKKESMISCLKDVVETSKLQKDRMKEELNRQKDIFDKFNRKLVRLL